jgi:hypothetical protein
MYKLDCKPYTDSFKKSRELADKTLARYGKPTLSVEELRMSLDRELDAISLSELILKERKAGW